ncbi:MAG: Txe/YoeB family addiction module toxin [Propionibacteriaceae bacterium]|jgi:toxin YoeB|nr:Txe/YoeB family addiction module toxin [Propionibacteriaceae bacterium]
MTLVWDESAWEDYVWWQENDRRMLPRINRLIKEAWRDPGSGIGKPERLKGDLTGWWSRRVNDEHRLVYRAVGDTLEIASCRYHYED